MLIANADLDGERVDVRLADGRIAEISALLSRTPGEAEYDAAGGAILPGLHDHHLHLHAMAAAAHSVNCGPPAVTDAVELAATLRAAARNPATPEELRGVGYHESVAGLLDRRELDRVIADRPVRLQHRGGALWILNSAALRRLGLLRYDPLPAGVELGDDGLPSGRLWRADDLFRAADAFPDLAGVGQRLLAYGITGVTDATPDLDRAALNHLAKARRSGALPQRLMLLGAPNGWTDPTVTVGPHKVLIHDHDLPSLDDLIAIIASSHAAGRAVAVHCVTRTSLVLALTAIESVGPVDGDRIEHAAVVPPELRKPLAALGLRVVTQPSFLHHRGDSYLTSVDPDDLPCLYPYASLVAAGVPVAASSDAPFGSLDPWQTIAAATTRSTATGAVINLAERVSPHRALAGYLSPPEQAGGSARRVAVGAPADVCVLSSPLHVALRQPSETGVVVTITGDRSYVAE